MESSQVRRLQRGRCCLHGARGAILEADPAPCLAVVLSAARGVTDALLGLIAAAERQEDVATRPRRRSQPPRRHGHRAVRSARWRPEFIHELDADCRDIASILHARPPDAGGIRQHARSRRRLRRDLVHAAFSRATSPAAAGGRACSGSTRAISSQRQWSAARADGAVGGLARNARRRRRAIAGRPATLIITGFIARDPQGLQTTLGRNGSDFSASIFGDLLDASEIHIWTDVDGVLSADPRRVPDATVIDSLSYHEAMELAYFGAKVIHPQTMAPAVDKRIPIWIRNTFAPEKPGTLICERPCRRTRSRASPASSSIALVNVEGAGMIGVPGTAQRLFGALARARDLRDPDLAGQLGAFDLLRGARGRCGPHRADGAPGVRRASCGRGRSRTSTWSPAAASCRSSATAWPERRASPPSVFGALAARRRQHPRHRPGLVRAQHLRRHRRAPEHARAALGARPVLPVAAHGLDRPDRPRHGRRACCSSSWRRSASGCCATSTSTCACAAS